jgi:hypothetical protein
MDEQPNYSMDTWKEYSITLDKGDLVVMSIESSLNHEERTYIYKKLPIVVSEIVTFFGVTRSGILLLIAPFIHISYYLRFINSFFFLNFK